MTGNALKRARAFLGYTQTQMAAACGMSLATFQRREALAEEHCKVVETSHVMRLLDDAIEMRQFEATEEAT